MAAGRNGFSNEMQQIGSGSWYREVIGCTRDDHVDVEVHIQQWNSSALMLYDSNVMLCIPWNRGVRKCQVRDTK